MSGEDQAYVDKIRKSVEDKISFEHAQIENVISHRECSLVNLNGMSKTDLSNIIVKLSESRVTYFSMAKLLQQYIDQIGDRYIISQKELLIYKSRKGNINTTTETDSSDKTSTIQFQEREMRKQLQALQQSVLNHSQERSHYSKIKLAAPVGKRSNTNMNMENNTEQSTLRKYSIEIKDLQREVAELKKTATSLRKPAGKGRDSHPSGKDSHSIERNCQPSGRDSKSPERKRSNSREVRVEVLRRSGSPEMRRSGSPETRGSGSPEMRRSGTPSLPDVSTIRGIIKEEISAIVPQLSKEIGLKMNGTFTVKETFKDKSMKSLSKLVWAMVLQKLKDNNYIPDSLIARVAAKTNQKQSAVTISPVVSKKKSCPTFKSSTLTALYKLMWAMVVQKFIAEGTDKGIITSVEKFAQKRQQAFSGSTTASTRASSTTKSTRRVPTKYLTRQKGHVSTSSSVDESFKPATIIALNKLLWAMVVSTLKDDQAPADLIRRVEGFVEAKMSKVVTKRKWGGFVKKVSHANAFSRK